MITTLISEEEDILDKMLGMSDKTYYINLFQFLPVWQRVIPLFENLSFELAYGVTYQLSEVFNHPMTTEAINRTGYKGGVKKASIRKFICTSIYSLDGIEARGSMLLKDGKPLFEIH